MGIGGSTALDIPGGGTEGYHVLKVLALQILFLQVFCFVLNFNANQGSRFITRFQSWFRSIF
jgi:hypothetical protein